ncbi:MAG: metal-sensing transcriptional repressor [Burkholderiaceae bacterium]
MLHHESRQDISKRLRRIEGQVRGVIRMVDEQASCMEIAQQLSAARKALDSVFARMTVCYLHQELEPMAGQGGIELDRLMDEVGTLLRRMG